MRIILALSLVALLSGCGLFGNSDSGTEPNNPQPPTPPVVSSISDGCNQVANYLNTVRYQSTVSADVGYAIMLQEYCAGSNTTGLVPGSSAKVIAYLTNLVADANAYGTGGPLAIPDISGF